MSAPAALAYGYARARARKSRVISATVLVGLVTADQPALTIPGWRDVENDHDGAALVSLLYARLIDDYVTMIRAYPAARGVLLALARLHELENVKLAWRAALGSVPPAEWRDCWRPMGALETISRTACEATSSPRHVGRASVGTPYEAIAKAVSSAHPGDLAAAEIAFDRWGSRELANATRALSESEGAARDLVWRVLRERDIALMERAVGPLGLPPESAVRMTAILADELGAAGIHRFAEWSAESGALMPLPPRITGSRSPVRTFAELLSRMRASRRKACRRVFLGPPFCLAPPIALVLLREDEVRGLSSIAELRARRAPADVAARVLDLDGY
jgi:vacuolar-type H+-ATPase subunit C/Vma6